MSTITISRRTRFSIAGQFILLLAVLFAMGTAASVALSANSVGASVILLAAMITGIVGYSVIVRQAYPKA